MTPNFPNFSPAPAVAEWINNSRAELSAAFEAVQKAELRAMEAEILVRDCERQIGSATAGLQRGGSIHALLERERERLERERARLSDIIGVVGSRIEAVCGEAKVYLGTSGRIRERVRVQISGGKTSTERVNGLREESRLLAGDMQQAEARVGGIEDALRAISRRSHGAGS